MDIDSQSAGISLMSNTSAKLDNKSKIELNESELVVSKTGPKKEINVAVYQNVEKLEQKLHEAKEALQTHFDVNNTKLNFSIHSESDRMVIRIIDPDSGETLKELPTEAVLKMVANIEKFQENLSNQTGFLFDEIV